MTETRDATSSQPLAATTLELATRLTSHWESHGQFVAGRETLESALAASDDPAPHRAAAHRAIATLSLAQGDLPAARAHLEAAIAIHDATGDERSSAAANSTLAVVLFRGGDLGPAERVGRSALARAGALGDDRGRGFVLTTLGLISAARGRPDDAFAHLLAALQLFRGDGARAEAASVLTNLGNVAHDNGDDQRSVRFYDGARQIFDGLGDRRGAAMCLNNLALMAAAHRDIDHAIELGRQAHEHFSAVGDVHGEAAMLNNLAGWWATHDAAEAAALYEQAIARFEKLGDTTGRDTARANLEALRVPAGEISKREAQVAALVASGLSNREIAAQLFISERTVHSHLSHIFTKLGVTSRTQLATWATRQGLFEDAGQGVRSSASVTRV